MTFANAHPDPASHPAYYDSVPTKRLFAWLIDLGITAALAALLTVPALLFGLILIVPLLFIPVIWACTGFVYRFMTISAGSATWGMKFMAIELRDREGHRLDASMAFLHTAGTYLSFAAMPVQLVSVAAMALTDRGQGVTDMVLGTAMLNRSV